MATWVRVIPGSLRCVLLLALPVLVLGCSDGGGSTAPSSPNQPTISNAVVTRQAGTCSLPGTNAQGTLDRVTFDYTDADGNLRGGTLQVTISNPAAGTLPFTVPIPSNGVTITGTTAGQVTFGICFTPTSLALQATISVTDAAGQRSNQLVVTL